MESDLVKLQRSPQEVARWKQAQQYVMGGRTHPALGIYRELLAQFPDVAQLLFEQGIAAAAELDFALSDESFARAAELAGKDVGMLVLIGQQYHRLRRFDRARECFERAVAVEPTSAHARLSLAAWLERERKLDGAWECVEACMAVNPRNPQALYFRAFLMHRRGKNGEAESALRGLLETKLMDANLEYSSRNLLGVVLDELGQYEEALRWLLDAKAGLRKATDCAALEKAYDRADRQRRELLSALTPETIRRWRKEGSVAGPAMEQPARLAFLGGHPRSGTTLIEQILGAHPGVMGFDEPEAFVQEISNRLAPMQVERKLSAQALDALPANARSAMARRYFKSLLRDSGTEPGVEVLLDKNPSPTAQLHLWLRVFPETRVIIALRDPRDVVISCFFQSLNGLTATNANFLTLERTVKHYGDLMDVWLRMRELGGFDWMETRYEDVVGGLEAEGRRVTEFVGLAWHEKQANYRESAGRKILHAPTYHDVAKPVYRSAMGRWEHYAEALGLFKGRLEAYCGIFGYPV
jgi:Flp pilus assembly protein TadD